MKNLKLFFKLQFTLAVLLLGATKSVAQNPVVQVPASCNVVVAGTSGTTGLGGKVGDGGIVVMPDPFDITTAAGNFTFLPNNTTVPLVTNTVGAWSLKGDLSAQTATTFGAVLQPAGTPTVVNIQSYNKTLRQPSENTAPSLSSWARSKGTVTIAYSKNASGNNCGNRIVFEVYKIYAPNAVLPVQPTNLPAIVGPGCLLPSTVYTYSVDQIASDNLTDNIGLDEYFWSGLPTGATNAYTSADKSSITFTSPPGPNPVPTFTLKCCYGRSNPWDALGIYTAATTPTSCVTKTVLGTPLAPTYVTGPPACHPTGSASFTIVYPNVVAPLVYTWTAPNSGWTFNAPVVGATNTSIQVNTPNNNPGGLVLTISGTACSNVVIPYQVNRSLTGTTLIVPNTTSPGSNCMALGSSNNQFYLGLGAAANNTNWTVTSVPAAAASFISLSPVTLQPNSTVAVSIASGAPVNATYTLTATANTIPACIGTSATYTFNVKPSTPTITAASGSSACVVKGALTPQTYNCTASTGASYNWVFPAGWSPATATTTTNSITVTPSSITATLNGNAFVTATGVGSCNSPLSAAFAINYNPVAPTFATTPVLNCISVGATTASVGITNAQTFGTYSVVSSPLGITSSGIVTGGNLALTIPPTLAAGSYSITITHTANPCGTASATLPAVTVGASGAAWAAGYPSYDPSLGGSDVYRVTPIASATYQWYSGPATFTTIGALTVIPPGTGNPNVSYSPSGNQMTLYGATALTNPNVYCLVTPLSGCPTIITAPRGSKGTARQASPNVKNQGERLTIYPNPNDGNFNILLDTVKEAASATLTDMNGKKLGTYTLTQGENKIKNRNLAAGTYIVVIQIDGRTETRQLIVK